MAEQVRIAAVNAQGRQSSFNGKIAGVTIGLSSIGLALIARQALPWGPMTIFLFGAMSVGVWAFCDEMGTEKPLIRAGLVAFVMAILGRMSWYGYNSQWDRYTAYSPRAHCHPVLAEQFSNNPKATPK